MDEARKNEIRKLVEKSGNLYRLWPHANNMHSAYDFYMREDKLLSLLDNLMRSERADEARKCAEIARTTKTWDYLLSSGQQIEAVLLARANELGGISPETKE
jgi:ABC-type arginine transport system ATPase subunit